METHIETRHVSHTFYFSTSFVDINNYILPIIRTINVLVICRINYYYRSLSPRRNLRAPLLLSIHRQYLYLYNERSLAGLVPLLFSTISRSTRIGT